MSALSAYWPAMGRAETIAGFPSIPSLVERGQKDGVGELYTRMHQREELVIAGTHIVEVPTLLAMAMDMFGAPDAIAADRLREPELRQALENAGIPPAALIPRGQGWKDGGADVRDFRRAALDGKIRAPVSLLLRSAIGGAVTISDPAGNAKLAKAQDSPERRDGHRDDAAASLILGVAVGYRKMRREDDAEDDEGPGYEIVH